jgi:protein-tyrosine phosphatase
MINILFVCMGNICRSPTAEGVVSKLLADNRLRGSISVDSAGTHAYHVGEPPDPRAQRAARSRGVDLSGLRARRVVAEDFESFDLILAMDRENLEYLFGVCPPQHQDKVRLFLSYARNCDLEEVPDPYYGGNTGFDRVLDLVEYGAQGLIDSLRRIEISGSRSGGRQA